MASILRKAVRNQFQSATTRIISNLNKSELDSNPKVSHCLFTYPSFSFGLFLNPVSQMGLIKSENDEDIDDSLKIWADSVKKKRKKKMNKHKLKKLRKCLRRKT
ncbi:unnamed protein product [Withania somnifera]